MSNVVEVVVADRNPATMSRSIKAAGLDEKLVKLLNDHVVEGATNFRDLKNDQKLVTANGTELTIKVNLGKVTVNGATLQGRDRIGSNGIMHSLDTVIEAR